MGKLLFVLITDVPAIINHRSLNAHYVSAGDPAIVLSHSSNHLLEVPLAR